MLWYPFLWSAVVAHFWSASSVLCLSSFMECEHDVLLQSTGQRNLWTGKLVEKCWCALYSVHLSLVSQYVRKLVGYLIWLLKSRRCIYVKSTKAFAVYKPQWSDCYHWNRATIYYLYSPTRMFVAGFWMQSTCCLFFFCQLFIDFSCIWFELLLLWKLEKRFQDYWDIICISLVWIEL